MNTDHENNNELCIKVAKNAEDTLAGFPYREGQFLSREEEGSDAIWLFIDLDLSTDTNTGQEEFLNTNPSVIEWTIR